MWVVKFRCCLLCVQAHGNGKKAKGGGPKTEAFLELGMNGGLSVRIAISHLFKHRDIASAN